MGYIVIFNRIEGINFNIPLLNYCADSTTLTVILAPSTHRAHDPPHLQSYNNNKAIPAGVVCGGWCGVWWLVWCVVACVVCGGWCGVWCVVAGVVCGGWCGVEVHAIFVIESESQ